MKLALSNLALPPFHHLSLLPHLRALGVEGLEIAPDHTWSRPQLGGSFSPSELGVYHLAAKSAGLEIVGLHALIGGRPELGIPDDLDAQKRTLEHLVHLSAVCRDLGGRTLILDSRWRGQLNEKTAWLQTREFLERLLPRIEDHGTILCFAPLAADEGDFCRRGRECYMLANAIDHSAFGLHMSTAGLTANGESGHANFAAARGRLDHFHIDEPGRVRLGASGAVDHVDMRCHLSAITYQGWVSIVQRFEKNTSAIETVMESVRFFNEIYLKSKPALDHPCSEDERLRLIVETIEGIRPAVQADGGDLELVAVNGPRVEVRLTGKCRFCAHTGQTLGGIRRKLTQALDMPVMVVPLAA
jgi:sugar phosphate isomerase/epimerase/Fe-S cluster biogenesis protein NfuA